MGTEVGDRHYAHKMVGLPSDPGDGLWAGLPGRAGEAQPALEQFWFDPPRLCALHTFRWGFSYRDLPGSLAAIRDIALEVRWKGSTGLGSREDRWAEKACSTPTPARRPVLITR